MTREEMWKEFEYQLKREVKTPMTMSYDASIRIAEMGIEDVVKKWKKRLEQAPRWIPVSERLPKPFSYVDCTCHSLIDDRKDWVVETFYLPQLQNSPYSDWGNIPMLNHGDCEVVAWMYREIPEPYEAESEGEG